MNRFNSVKNEEIVDEEMMIYLNSKTYFKKRKHNAFEECERETSIQKNN